MRNRSGSRYLSLFALVAIGLIVLWRTHLLKSTRPTAHSGSAPAGISASTDGGKRDLDWDERQGGHTLHRHVGRSESELVRRLEREAGIAAASSFDDRATAEAVIVKGPGVMCTALSAALRLRHKPYGNAHLGT